MTTELSKTEPILDFLLISNFNLSNLAALLSKDEESPMIRAVTAPSGQVMQVLFHPAPDPWRKGTQGAVVWKTHKSVRPSYRRLLESEEPAPEELMHEVD